LFSPNPYHNNISTVHSDRTAGTFGYPITKRERQLVLRCFHPALRPQLHKRMFAPCHLGNHCSSQSSAPLKGSACGYIAVLVVARGPTKGTRTAFGRKPEAIPTASGWNGFGEGPSRGTGLICYCTPTTVAADMAMYRDACTLEALGTSQPHSAIGTVHVQVLDKSSHRNRQRGMVFRDIFV